MIQKKVEQLTGRLAFGHSAHHMRVFKDEPTAGEQTVYSLDLTAFNALTGLTGDDENDLPIYEAAYQAQ
jgi:hypothetical protein